MIPKWAQDLVIDATYYVHQNDGVLPDVKWRKATRRYSSGYCGTKGITICAGRDRTDAKLVVLHEMAHWLRPRQLNRYGNPAFIEGHTPEFWDMAWELYRWAKLPIRYCLKRERTYRKGAILAYRRSK